MKTIGLILSYNAPVMTDRLCESIGSAMPLIVVDNGSDPDKISRFTTDRIQTNCRMTKGFNWGLDLVEEQYHETYDNIWLFTHDCYFTGTADPVAVAHAHLKANPDVGILHPSLSNTVKVCYPNVVNNGHQTGLADVKEFDFVCPLFTKEALWAIGHQFNPDLHQGWGIDYESSYMVRNAGKRVSINFDTVVNHNTSYTYDHGLDHEHMDREAYYTAAGDEMRAVFTAKYGPHWHQLFME